MPDETQGVLTTLRASMPYLETAPLRLFRRELIVQALDGTSKEERAQLLEDAELEIDHDVCRP